MSKTNQVEKEPTGALVLFDRKSSVIQVEKDGTVSVDMERVKKSAEKMSLPNLTRFYTDVAPQIQRVLEMVDAIVVKRLEAREATRLPIADDDGQATGQELVIKPTFKNTEVDDELLEEAQKTIRQEGLPCNLIIRERCLVLDDVTLNAFGISEQKLKQYGDKIRILSNRTDLHTIRKAAKVGGVGGDLIMRALTETKGRTKVYVEGKANKITGPDDDLGGEK